MPSNKRRRDRRAAEREKMKKNRKTSVSPPPEKEVIVNVPEPPSYDRFSTDGKETIFRSEPDAPTKKEGDPLRILHISQANLANIPHLLTEEFRKFNYFINHWDFHIYKFLYPVGIGAIGFSSYKRVLDESWVKDNIPSYDIFHWHCQPFCPDPQYEKKLINKTWVTHYHGTNLREKGGDVLLSANSKLILVSTPDLLNCIFGEYREKTEWIRNPVTIEPKRCCLVWEDIPPIEKPKDKITVVHICSHRRLKGFDEITKVLHSLPNVNPVVVSEVFHHEALQYIAQADVVLDQVKIGWYGVQAVEAWLSKVPTIGSLDDELVKKYEPDCPHIGIDTDNLRKGIRDAIDSFSDPEERRKKGEAAYKFAKQKHDPAVVATEMLKLYKKYGVVE